MARYFFELHECGIATDDEQGLELTNLDEAHGEALRSARSVMCSEIAEGRLCLSCRIDVKDRDGALVLSIPFRDAVEITGLQQAT